MSKWQKERKSERANGRKKERRKKKNVREIQDVIRVPKLVCYFCSSKNGKVIGRQKIGFFSFDFLLI